MAAGLTARGRSTRVAGRTVRSATPAALLLCLLVAPATADPIACRGAIAGAAAKHVQKVATVLGACRARVLAGTLPRSTDCRAQPALTAVRAKLGAAVARACCGVDGVCGTPDDEPLAAAGWDVGTCPDLESAGCARPVADPSEAADCLDCLVDAGAGELLELTYGTFGPGTPGSALARCRAALGRETVRLFAATTRALQRCRDARNRGRHANPCPTPGDGHAAEAIARAEASAVARLCRACGGLDGVCGGSDDLPPATIGVLDTCPAATVPDGGSCAAPIATLADLVACADCRVAFAARCLDAAAEPAFLPYPPACDPPRGTCTPGVECQTSLDCPAGYPCTDNGAGTRYCVGAPCTTDPECGEGGVCRQYCTASGCGPRLCQCPGFGCFGPDEVCLDDGGLACRKLCTQDSDCTAPHGFVCVNPGFGFGVCIGSIPCQ